ncbi:MAG TPA: lipocalin family protein [Gemmatimonadaceae bacterium]|jgi:hypothetical protein|nr:lipocalin family protein [Gemmatimonadaceae bacterium]
MRKALAVAVAVGTFGLAACGGGAGDSLGPGSLAGTYNLQTVNGKAPPAVLVEDGSYKLEVLSGTYTLNADNSYSATASFRETENGVVTPSSESETGSYSVHGSAVTFTDSDGFQLDATISGSTMTIVADGLTVRYSR